GLTSRCSSTSSFSCGRTCSGMHRNKEPVSASAATSIGASDGSRGLLSDSLAVTSPILQYRVAVEWSSTSITLIGGEFRANRVRAGDNATRLPYVELKRDNDENNDCSRRAARLRRGHRVGSEAFVGLRSRP